MFTSEEASMRVREEIYTEKTTLTVLQRLTVLVLQYSKKQVFYLCGILVLHTFVRARTHTTTGGLKENTTAMHHIWSRYILVLQIH